MNSIIKNVQSTLKVHNIIALVGLLILGVAIYQYSTNKNNTNDNMATNTEKNVSGASNNLGNISPAPVSNMNGQQKEIQNPADLLPKDENSEWAKLNPAGNNDLSSVNLLKSGYHIGIDTVGNTLRNANLQIRSEPPNPTTMVSPWLQSTIEPDQMRPVLEIGN